LNAVAYLLSKAYRNRLALPGRKTNVSSPTDRFSKGGIVGSLIRSCCVDRLSWHD
jgi:hypothetical protein